MLIQVYLIFFADPGTEKCHFFFTLRDTPTDFINVNCWGNERFIYDLANSFKINDVGMFYYLFYSKQLSLRKKREKKGGEAM